MNTAVRITLRNGLRRLWLHDASLKGDVSMIAGLPAALDTLLERESNSSGGLKFFEASQESRLINRLFPAGLPGYAHLHELRDECPVESAISRVMTEFLTVSPKFREQLETALAVSLSSVPVLISGESGSGKEYLARMIHRESQWSGKPLTILNCGALPDALIHTELFGYEPGAFTGAGPRGGIGKLEASHGGTLLLDEVGELSAVAQSALLRFLESGEVQKIGRTTPLKVQTRILTATHRDLTQMVKAGEFREDLFYRLALIPIKIPPLRERHTDLQIVIDYFLSQLRGTYHREYPTRLSSAAFESVRNYTWPGNLRELKFVLERAFLLTHGPEITELQISGTPKTMEQTQPALVAAIEARLTTLGSSAFANTVRWSQFLARFADSAISNSDVAREFGISETAARIRLGELVRAGILTCTGEKRGRRYRLSVRA